MGSLPTEPFLPLDPDRFTKESKAVVDFIADYYRQIELFPVRSQVKPGYLHDRIPNTPPILSEPITTILHDIKTDIFPGLTHWQSPNFYGYYQANASTPGFAGEMLCSGLNVVGFSWIASPAATELETIIMDWMAKMLKLPSTFLSGHLGGGGGVIHGSTCEAVLCTLAAARDNALSKSDGEGITKLTVYVSDQTHFTVQKAAKLVGIPTRNLRVISTSRETGYALTAEIVRAAMDADVAAGMVPLYLCGTVGTTAVGAVDPIREIGEVAREFGVWFHVDAAYAGSAGICPEFRRFFDGVETADSFSLNPHKWLLANMDCCCLWVRCATKLVDSLSTKPEILTNSASEDGKVIDYKDWQVALSRRFRAMKLWIVIRRFGVANLMEHIRSDVEMAKHFERLVAEDERFEVVVPRRFTLVCFKLRYVGEDIDEEEGTKCWEMNKKLLDSVNESGRAFMTHAVVCGQFVLRFALGATLTEIRHVEETWRLVQEKASELLMITNELGWKLKTL
uniref:Putative phenylacetaldehyde synthase n=1 Tax=Vanda hybrid cultivar TaxID=484756 RepID=D6PAY0_9ASPA|nr:putative phenylacetaldehyde synthase [Vanda hybrid cultivar]